MAEIQLTLRGELIESGFNLTEDRQGNKVLFTLRDGEVYKRFFMKVEDEKLQFFDSHDLESFVEEKYIVEERLMGLYAEWLETKSNGVDPDSGSTVYNVVIDDRNNYGPEDILISTKFYTIEQVLLLAEREDIEMYPDFQRNFVWDKTRQSRLIESIFLGLPLPSFYLSQYDDGRLTVVDGLQRLNAIRLFYLDKLRLGNLEYLDECEGCTFSEIKTNLSPLRIRNFMQTQLTCYVIDYRSPQRLKYDLFKGKPLKNNYIALLFHKYVMGSKATGGVRQGYAKKVADRICEENYYHEAPDLSASSQSISKRECSSFIKMMEHTSENSILMAHSMLSQM